MPDPTCLRTVVVDDETLSREKVVRYLRECEDIDIVAEARTGTEARAAILATRPNIVFLDIRLPDTDGLTMAEDLRSVLGKDIPEFIISTAYDTFALRAFGIHALDYLVKPYSRERFQRAVSHARSRCHLKQTAITAAQSVQIRKRTFGPRITFRTQNKLLIFETREIVYLRAADNYVTVHTASERHMVRAKISDLEEELDRAIFLRIHRSILVNVRYFREVDLGGDDHDAAIVLSDGSRLPLTRTFRSEVLQKLQGLG
jgi:two-component system LytT family response regulator